MPISPAGPDVRNCIIRHGPGDSVLEFSIYFLTYWTPRYCVPRHDEIFARLLSVQREKIYFGLEWKWTLTLTLGTVVLGPTLG